MTDIVERLKAADDDLNNCAEMSGRDIVLSCALNDAAAEIERRRKVLSPEPAWVLEQARSLSSDKDDDAVGALAWNLTVFLRRLEDRAAQMDGEG